MKLFSFSFAKPNSSSNLLRSALTKFTSFLRYKYQPWFVSNKSIDTFKQQHKTIKGMPITHIEIRMLTSTNKNKTEATAVMKTESHPIAKTNNITPHNFKINKNID